MLIQAKSFNSHTLWDSDYQATVLNAGALPMAKPIFIEESLSDADYSGMFTRDLRNVALSVKILDYGNREALQAQLKAWFKPGTRADLVVTFAVDGLDYSLPCVAQMAPVHEGDQRYTILLQSEATAWRAVDPDTDTWSLSGAGGTHVITVEGDDETRLSVTLTPTVETPAGWKKQQLYRLVPPNGINWGLRPWCIQLDTAALVTAGKMQADCDDLRIWLGESETRRWIDGPNTTTTKVWFNLNLRRGATLTLRTAVAATGDISYLYFTKNATMQARIRAMPSQGVVYHGTEWFYYSAKQPVACRLVIEERGLYDTTLQAHAVGDSFSFLPAAVRVVYGNPTATDPALDDENYDDTKPLFSLSQSDNTQWTWTASDKFYDPDHPNRPGGWTQSLQRIGTESKLYWVKQDAESGNAAMGMMLAAWQQGSVWKAERATAAWSFYSPGGMQEITVTGQKYRNTVKWPNQFAAIRRSPDGTTWFTVFNEATPASVSTWSNLTNNGVAKAIDSASKYVQAIFSKVLAAQANAYAMFEIQTCTVEFTTANIPSGTLLGEQLNYPLDITLQNNATGEAIDLKYPMRMNRPLALDGEANTITYQRANAHNAISLDDEGRAIWIRLVKGDNELEVIGDDVGTLELVLSWYRRRL